MAFPGCCQAPPDVHIKLVWQIRTKTFEGDDWGPWSGDVAADLVAAAESEFFNIHQGPEPYFPYYAAEVQVRWIYDASPSCYLEIKPVATYDNLDGSFNSFIPLGDFIDNRSGAAGSPCWKPGLDFADDTTWWHLPTDDSYTLIAVPGDGSISQVVWNASIVRP